MCSFISLKSDLFKRVFFFYAGKCFAERAPPFCSGSAAFTLRAFTMALHATSRPQPGPRGVTWLLPPVQWHLPVPSSTRPSSAVSRSFTVPPCGLSAQPTRLLSVVRQGEGSFSCLIPLVLDNTGPGPQSPLDP